MGACAPTASRTWTAPQGSSAATGSARSPAMATQLRNQQLHQPQPQLLQNRQLPPTHPALRSAAQTTTVRTEHAKTETVCPTPLPQSQAQLLRLQLLQLQLPQQQPASFSAVQMMTANRVLSARTESARSLARMMPTAREPTQFATPTMTTASTALQTISVKMVLLTPTAGRTCPAAVLPTAARRLATRP